LASSPAPTRSNGSSRPQPSNSELVGLVAAGIILFTAFGSLFAALPLLTGAVALGSGLLAVSRLAHVVSIGTIGPTLAGLIGLGVGIDYALFTVTARPSVLPWWCPRHGCRHSHG
jgi:RND superfamily putative drug exporter